MHREPPVTLINIPFSQGLKFWMLWPTLLPRYLLWAIQAELRAWGQCNACQDSYSEGMI